MDYEKRQSLADFAGLVGEARACDEYRTFTPEESRERLEEAFGTVRATEGHRLAVAWRIARAIGAAQGHVAQEVGLGAVPEIAWCEHTASHVQGHPEGTPPWVLQVAQSEIPILPRGLLEHADDSGLAVYQGVVSIVATRLGLGDDRPNRLGLRSLLDILLGQEDALWPEPWQLVALEDALVDEVFRTATSSPDVGGIASERRASHFLIGELGLTRPEAESVLAMARERAIQAMPSGQEALRALQFHALSDGARRAALNHDLKAEVAFRRLLAQVTGVTRTEPEDAMGAFVNVVKRIASSEVRPALASARPRELPAPQAENTARAIGGTSEAVESDCDSEAEALREWDEENPGQRG